MDERERERERLARSPGGFMTAHCIDISYMKGRKKKCKNYLAYISTCMQ